MLWEPPAQSGSLGTTFKHQGEQSRAVNRFSLRKRTRKDDQASLWPAWTILGDSVSKLKVKQIPGRQEAKALRNADSICLQKVDVSFIYSLIHKLVSGLARQAIVLYSVCFCFVLLFETGSLYTSLAVLKFTM